MRVVSWNLQHGVPDPVGRPALGARGRPLRDAGGRRLRVPGARPRAARRTRFAHQGAAARRGPRRRGAVGAGQALARGRRRRTRSSSAARCCEPTWSRCPAPGERRVAVLASVGGRRAGAGRWPPPTCPSIRRSRDRAAAHGARRAGRARPKPWVLAGDLNLLPAQVAPRRRARPATTCSTGPFTINARTRPNRRLDHVLRQRRGDDRQRHREAALLTTTCAVVGRPSELTRQVGRRSDRGSRELQVGVAVGVGLDEAVGLLVAVLLGRALHEVGARALERAAHAAVEADLGAAHGVDDHAGGVGGVVHLELELDRERARRRSCGPRGG